MRETDREDAGKGHSAVSHHFCSFMSTFPTSQMRITFCLCVTKPVKTRSISTNIFMVGLMFHTKFNWKNTKLYFVVIVGPLHFLEGKCNNKTLFQM